ncbi:MAG TPA: glutamate formimidoyltransferase [Anaerovoracaceae bacterium]|nr:glutamate formimidoyltransferase [Anaerovoracaceae bacterium]
MAKIVECVPNFSEGRDFEKIGRILAPFQAAEGCRLLDHSADKDHNRVVVTVMGEPQSVKKAVVEAVGAAIREIDMNRHSGGHPRMGAADVIPFIPIMDMTMAEAVELAEETAREIATRYDLPVFLYEKAASAPERENLANVRKGEFEGLIEKLERPEWKPDFGPARPHPTAGAAAVGARMPLVAFNINLDTTSLEIADKIARCIRHISGGFRFTKAMGVDLKERGIVQVSINMTDYTKTALYRVFETVKFEARRYGVSVVGSEIVGLAPMEALLDAAAYYLQLEDFDIKKQVIESRILE